jgi:hypothetical protein
VPSSDDLADNVAGDETQGDRAPAERIHQSKVRRLDLRDPGPIVPVVTLLIGAGNAPAQVPTDLVHALGPETCGACSSRPPSVERAARPQPDRTGVRMDEHDHHD